MSKKNTRRRDKDGRLIVHWETLSGLSVDTSMRIVFNPEEKSGWYRYDPEQKLYIMYLSADLKEHGDQLRALLDEIVGVEGKRCLKESQKN